MKSYLHITQILPNTAVEDFPLLLGRWFQGKEHTYGLCAGCFRFIPAQWLYLCIRPFGKGEEWKCDECPGVRVKTN